MKTQASQPPVKAIAEITRFAGLTILTLLLSGCCTPALWKERVYRPTVDTNLQLARASESGDVLVQYDEYQIGSKKTQSRAYWLFAYQSSLTDTNPWPKPVFVDAQTVTNLSSIPIFLARPGRRVTATNDCYAVYAQSLAGFELWDHQTKTGEYRLPFYSLRWSTPGKRVALTPVAVVGDTVLIGGVLALLSGAVALMMF